MPALRALHACERKLGCMRAVVRACVLSFVRGVRGLHGLRCVAVVRARVLRWCACGMSLLFWDTRAGG